MTATRGSRRWAGVAVALLTVAWVLVMLALVCGFAEAFTDAWGASDGDDPGRAAELSRATSDRLLLVALVAPGGLLLIALVAFTLRLSTAGVCYLALATGIGLTTAPFALLAYEKPRPSHHAPTGPPVRGGCQEHSGSDTRCPGG